MDLQPAANNVEVDDAIAIVGLGACLPDAPNVPQFWANVCRGHVAIGEVPPERWRQETYFDRDKAQMDRTYSRIGGFIRYDPFDPRKFRLVPKSLPAIDDLQKMALVAVAEALGQAGLKVFAKDEQGRTFDRERCATIFGNTMGGEAEDRTSLRVWLLEVEDALVQSARQAGRSDEEARQIAAQLHAYYAPKLPKVTEDSMPGELSNCITGRIANVFDLCGANFTTDAACASTMAAVQAGVTGLRNREFDTAVVGGADRSMDPPTFVKFCRIGALSPDRSTPFDEGANGFVMGEGVGVLVLKRLEDAMAEGLSVLAVIRGIGASSDGRGKGMTAPNPRGQRLAVQRAWAASKRNLADVGLIEAHGTSTAVGDSCELGVLDTLLEEAGRQGAPVPVGSVKSMIGHLKSASGAASLIKATLALHHRRLPPSAGFRRAAPDSPLHRGRLQVQTQDGAWDARQGPRLVGVSSFGFGGTNFHVVLEEAPTVAPHQVTSLPTNGASAQGPQPAMVAASAAHGHAAATAAAAATTTTPAEARPAPSLAAVLADVAATFAEATGYATEELEPTHHLEADLGIDSVKQAEVMAVLRERYAVATEAPAKLAELATLEAIAGFLHGHAAAAAPAPTATASVQAPLADAAAGASAPAGATAPSGAEGALPGPHVFAFGGATLEQAVAHARQALDCGASAWQAARAEAHAHPARLAFVAADAAEASGRLDDVAQKGSKGARLLAAKGIFVAEGAGLAEAGEVAFLFPGQGSQYLGMLEDLAGRYPVVADTFAEADRILAPLLGQTLTDIVWPAARDEAHELALRRTEICQPAMLTADVALARLLAQFGVAPKVVVGHSLGEYAATVVAGVLSFADALYAVSARGREMAGVKVDDPGRMAMVAADAERVEAVLASIDGYVIAANKNCHTQTVIAGGSAAVDAALAAFAAQGIEARPIAVSHAFHSAIVAPAAEPLRRVLQGLDVRAPKIPLSSNVDAALYPHDPAAIVDRLARQLASPVRFIEQVENLYAQGARLFVEVGPKRAITGFVRNILGTRPHRALACNHPKKPGVQGVLETLAALVADGVQVAFDGRPDPARGAQAAPNAPSPRAEGDQKAHLSAAPRGPAPAARTGERIVITGTSVLLPGQTGVPDWRADPYAPLLAGENFIGPVPQAMRQRIADKKVVRLDKASGSFVTLDGAEDVLHHAARMGPLDLTAWGIDPGLIEAMDVTARLTVAAGLDALRDAGLPLVEHLRTTSTGSKLHDRWGLPTQVAATTGVILASAFCSLDAVLGEAHREAERRGSGASFDRKWLFRALPMGHAQLAQLALAQGPNTQINAACASGTQALAMASDWIRLGRCERVIVVTADDVGQDDALSWIGAGFLAAGAASVEPTLVEAAVPFGARRNGLILGSGASAFVVEAESSAAARGIAPIAELAAAEFANSAFHGTRLETASITRFLGRIVDQLEPEATPEARAKLAERTLFLSHETYTPARGGSAAAEVDSLRAIFGEAVKDVTIANTKGFTGHPMGASFEDLVAVKGLQRGQVPPIANFHRPDPDFADLRFADGAPLNADVAVRFAAGFGSQIAACAYRRCARSEGRLVDEAAFAAWCTAQGIDVARGFEVHKRVLRAAHRDGRPLSALGVASLTAPAPGGDPGAPDAADIDRGQVAIENQMSAASAAPAATPAVAAAPSPAALLAELTALFAEQTGYDARELDPDHALEADLGIDSVKQAEILAMVRERYRIGPDVALPAAQAQTLGALRDWVAAHGGHLAATRADENLAVPAASPAAQDAPTAASDASRPAPGAPAATPAGAASASATSPAASAAALAPDAAPASQTSSKSLDRDALLGELTALFAEETGYDVAELAPDHALEADLGIDSVKQAEILAMVRARYNVGAEQPLKLASATTLSALTDWLQATQAPRSKSPAAEPALAVRGDAHVAASATASAPETPGSSKADDGGSAVPASPADRHPGRGPSDPVPDQASLLAALTALFAEQTGYDVAELAPDHALEADLGIDSVKQAEILAIVRQRYHLQAQAPFKLAEVTTLQALATAVHRALQASDDHQPPPAGAALPAPSAVAPAASVGAPPAVARRAGGAEAAPARAVAEIAPAPPPAPASAGTAGENDVPRPAARDAFAARQVTLVPVPRPQAAVADKGWLGQLTIFARNERAAHALAAHLGGAAREVRVHDPARGPHVAVPDAAIFLAEPDTDADLFAQARVWGQGAAKPQRLCVLSVGGGGFGLLSAAAPQASCTLAAASGVLKSLAKEWPTTRTLGLDVVAAPGAPAPTLAAAAAHALAALAAPADAWPYLEAVAACAGDAPDAAASLWAAPARAPKAVVTRPVPLRAGARVVVTGGARGITYALLHALAERRPLDVVILGRTQAVDPAHSPLAGKSDAARRALAKAALAEAGERDTPAAVRGWLAAEDGKLAIYRNLEALRALGCTVRLLVCDVGRADALGDALERLRADGVPTALLLHGAGFEESRRIEDKDAQALSRTCAPKVAALRTLVAGLRPARWVSMGSIAGRFGNGAQTDYAAANETLAAEARMAAGAGLNLGWTAWAGLGMAERGSVRRVLEAGGVTLIPSATGVALGAQLIESDVSGDVVVAAGLGTMAAGEARLAAPFVDAEVRLQAQGPTVCLRRTFDPARDRGLDHHRIDGVPVLPGVLGVELMVQAAAAVRGEAVRYLKDVAFAAPVKFFRDRPLDVDVEVEPTADGLRLSVCTTFVGPGQSPQRRRHFTAEAPDVIPARPEAAPAPLRSFGPVRAVAPLDRAAIYARYFHGPAFQVLADGPRLGDGGIDADTEPASGDWLADWPNAAFASDPYVREAGFQAAGLHEMAEDGRMALPAGIAELWLGGGRGAAQIAARRTGDGAQGASYVVQATYADGKTDVMRGYHTVVLRPLDAAALLPRARAARADREMLSLRETSGLLAPEAKDALAFYLSAAERRRLAQLTVKKRREDWLGGRLAAKALVRRSWPRAGAKPAWSAMTVAADANGEPELLLDAEAGATLHDGAPRLSISHSGDVAAAVVSWDHDRLVGIDVERVARRDAAFARTYFTEAEQAWAAAEAAPARAHTILWAVKEAALKALGVVAKVDMRALEVQPRGTTSGAPAASAAEATAFALLLRGEAAEAARARGLQVGHVAVDLQGQQVVAQVTLERKRQARSDVPRAGSSTTHAAEMQ